MTFLDGVEGGLGLVKEGLPLCALSTGSTCLVTDVAIMPREGLALQAGHSIGRDRPHRGCSSCLEIPGEQRGMHRVGGAVRGGSV